MIVLKAMVPLSDGLYRMSVVEYQGMFWLVPTWLDLPRKGWSKPGRLICLSLLQHQQMMDNPNEQFLVSYPIPKSLLSGPIPPELAIQYTVIDLPDLEFETHSYGPVH